MAPPLAEVIAAVREVLGKPDVELRPDMRFDDIEGWDSMDLVSIVVELECRCNLQFELPEIDRLTTVNDLLQLIEAKRGLAAAA